MINKDPSTTARSQVIERLFRQSTSLTELESAAVLAAYGVPFTATVMATSPDEAQAATRKISSPVVMKVISRDISHKSDAGGVILGVTEETASASYERILNSVQKAHPNSTIDGVLVQKQESGGIEVIIGAVRDLQFGHAVMFGLGGIFAEVINDVAFRIAPLTEDEAREMIDETRGAKILRGQRGQPPADIEALCSILAAVSRLVEDCPQISELDLNPVIAKPRGAVVVDAVIRTENVG